MLSMTHSDADTIQAVTEVFHRSLLIPHEGITITAVDGTVWLEGTVKWEFERMAAIDRALDVPGVGAVYNRLDVAHPYHHVITIPAPAPAPGPSTEPAFAPA